MYRRLSVLRRRWRGEFILGGNGMTRTFELNDRYRPIVTIKKIKKDVPTVIEVSGRRYVLEHVDNYKGGRKK